MSLEISRVCSAISPSPTLAIDAKAKEMRAQGRDVISFCAGEPDFVTPAYIRDAAHEALDKGVTKYTPASGTMELRRAICDKLLRDNGLTYTPAQVVVSNGAKSSLFEAFSAILNPGDEVLIPTPCWVSYPEMVRIAGGVPVFIDAEHKTAHNKVTVTDGRWVVTGSYNYNTNAETRNAENLLILDSPALAARYEENWLSHRTHSSAFTVRPAGSAGAANRNSRLASLNEKRRRSIDRRRFVV